MKSAAVKPWEKSTAPMSLCVYRRTRSRLSAGADLEICGTSTGYNPVLLFTDPLRPARCPHCR
ncbi:MAG: hypothetical protein LBV28_01270, partial [Puniceicoccales bacterium]|nr:hypothetical protein [Puniceicoccales bacterium]